MRFHKERTERIEERIEEMKKKIIIISSIIVCLLIVGGITFIAHNKTSEDKTSDVTESLEAETSTDADKESDVSTDKEKDDTSTNKKETNTVESDKKEDEKKTDDKTTEEQKTEDKKTDNKKTEADKKTTENTGSNSESTKKEEEHKHTWVTGYRTEEKVVHHDAVTHTETQTTYTTETTTVHHESSCRCCNCGAIGSESEIISHIENNMDCFLSGAGYVGTPGYDEQVSTQVPHNETVTVVDQAAYDETVVEKIEYTYCSECGAEK